LERLAPASKDITVGKGKLSVKNFETIDNEVVSYFQDIQPEQQGERFDRVVKTGVIALKTVGIAERLDYVQKEFMSLNNDFGTSLDNAVNDLDNKF